VKTSHCPSGDQDASVSIAELSVIRRRVPLAMSMT
jgi:hypothetical protein